MRILLRWALILLALARPAVSAEKPRLALVVFNSAYQSLPALPACQASAAIVTASLERGGWNVTQLRDPSNGQLGAGLAQFGEAAAKAPGGAALVYACGYAAAFEGRLFLLPTSSRLVRDTDVLTEGVVLPALTGVTARAELGAGLIVADLVALPGSAPIAAEVATRREPGPRTGLLVAAAAASPDGPTLTAAALAQALAGRSLSVADAQATILQALTAAGGRGAIRPPAEVAWLTGPPPSDAEPPAPVAAAPSAPAEPAAPAEPPAPPAPAQPPPVSTPTVAPAALAPAVLGDLDRRRVQLALQRLGYYAGRVDGTFGPESLAAIRRYQHELGGEMNGKLTEDQAARLLSAP